MLNFEECDIIIIIIPKVSASAPMVVKYSKPHSVGTAMKRRYRCNDSATIETVDLITRLHEHVSMDYRVSFQ